MVEATEQMKKYFGHIQSETHRAYAIAKVARAKGYDPETDVDIPLAANMAERVVGLISLVAPQLSSSKLSQRIQELEREYAHLDWRVGLKIGEEVAKQKFCTFKNEEEAIEIGIRVGFAYLTLGIVAAPLEGFIGLKVKQRKDGKKYLAIYYAGPVRGAGGTAAATSVILADYIRTTMGFHPYDPTEEEVNRFVTEIHDYHDRVTNLQYHPSDDELKFLMRHIPVEINGDPTEEMEVSNFKDLPRVETNRIRGGICLVIAEGVAQKSPKIWKRLSKWGKNFGLHWDFLEEFLVLQKKIKAGASGSEAGVPSKITPNFTFIADLVAGRPVLSYPMRNGGFRLRYGRTHASGFSSAGVHPATLAVLENYIAIGTQLKTERPGKAATVTLCDTIDGPVLKLENGSVLQLDDSKKLKQLPSPIAEILYLGDILFSYGDFSENGHKLVPSGYCEEWWVQELEKSVVTQFGNLDAEKIAAHIESDADIITALLKNPLTIKPTFDHALKLATYFSIPLHPAYTYMWNSISCASFLLLVNWMKHARVDNVDGKIKKIVLPLQNYHNAKRALEVLAVPHTVVNNEFVVLVGDHAACFFTCVSHDDSAVTAAQNLPNITLKNKKNYEKNDTSEAEQTLSLVTRLVPFVLRDKAGTFIGARMGRPEKAKMRKLSGSPHILFPVGDEGERLRSFQSALKHGKIDAEFALFFCSGCEEETIYPFCILCGKRTVRRYHCRECGVDEKETCRHGAKRGYKKMDLNIQHYFQSALKELGTTTYPDLIKGVRGTSNKFHVVEHVAKGILRSKHAIFVNKDGTTRYDMTELPLTHFKPKEIGTSIAKLHELGYTVDVFGKELQTLDQICELKPQDIVLPLNENSLEESSKKVLYRIAQFVDDLLEKLYGQKRFYNLNQEDDIVGHLVIGLAPHISAGLIGRIIGFSQTQGCLAHPLWHAGLRRDCDGDEACVMMLLDGLLNFSRQYLPNQRGAKTMDSPLVLTSQLIPSEVDDQSHGLDIQWQYPLSLYEAALEYKDAGEVKVDQIKHRLGKETQFEQFGFTHGVTDLNNGVKCSSYKLIPTMSEKLQGQMVIAAKIRAVKESDVARLIIDKHFIKDIKGNLRRFTTQRFRCIQCGEKYRRPPLIGKCMTCKGKIIFTVTYGSIVKYLQPSFDLAKQFDLPPYMEQTLEITRRRIEGVFGRDKEKQSGLNDF